MPTALPASTDFTGSGVTEAQFKTAITGLRDYLSGLLGTDGVPQTALVALGAIMNTYAAKTGAYTVVAGDKGKVIDATTGTWTLSLTAASTLGAGFAFAVKNSGSGVITIDPNGSEQIDGATTVTLAASESCFVLCDGSMFRTVSKAATLTSAAIATALGFTPASSTHNHSGVYVPVDANYSNVGSFVMAYYHIVSGGAYLSPGGTVSGSYLFPCNADVSRYGSALSGTWRALGYANTDWGGTLGPNCVSIFQRIS